MYYISSSLRSEIECEDVSDSICEGEIKFFIFNTVHRNVIYALCKKHVDESLDPHQEISLEEFRSMRIIIEL